jgi:hypothetical protein
MPSMEFIRDEEFRGFPLSILFVAQHERAQNTIPFSDVVGFWLTALRAKGAICASRGQPTGTVQSQVGWRMHGAKIRVQKNSNPAQM